MTTSSRKPFMINGYTKEEIGRRWEIDPSLPDKEFEATFALKVKADEPPLSGRIQNDPDEE